MSIFVEPCFQYSTLQLLVLAVYVKMVIKFANKEWNITSAIIWRSIEERERDRLHERKYYNINHKIWN
jgi:hypothetical protein